MDVTADWCAPCKVAAPFVAELPSATQADKVVVIDGNEAPELVATLGVRGFPTFLGFWNGEVVDRLTGFGNERGLEVLSDRCFG